MTILRPPFELLCAIALVKFQAFEVISTRLELTRFYARSLCSRRSFSKEGYETTCECEKIRSRGRGLSRKNKHFQPHPLPLLLLFLLTPSPRPHCFFNPKHARLLDSLPGKWKENVCYSGYFTCSVRHSLVPCEL